jgi:ribonuclease/clavin/mitogillin
VAYAPSMPVHAQGAVPAGVQVLPLRTPTLPPAETTNAVVLGPPGGRSGPRWIVDPATPHGDERQRLLDTLGDLNDLAGIALTHHHRDHVGAAAWLSAELGLPVWAHGETERLARTHRGGAALSVTHVLGDGDRLADWTVLHTPGHASDHLVFLCEATRVAVVGDMVASEGTIVVDPPDGHMGTYLHQLARLRDLPLTWAIPAHGPPIGEPRARFEAYLAHRAQREGRVLAALRDGPRTLRALTAEAWAEVPAAVLPLAERACLAHLGHLAEQGLARVDAAPAGLAAWTSEASCWRSA